MNCQLSALVSIGLFSASFACSTSSDPERLQDVLTDKQYDLYEKIIMERTILYLYGLLLGIVVSSIVSSYLVFDNVFHDVAFFVGVAWAVAVFYYLIVPKKNYILPHLNESQARVWHDVYVSMKHNYLMGGLLGMLAAIPVATMACRQ